MPHGSLLLGGLLAGLVMFSLPAPAPPRHLVVRAADGLRVHATLHEPRGGSGALVVLFHQTLSNRWEYAPIVPELIRTGCAALAVDLRVGGTMWGEVNETWMERPEQDQGEYLAALSDMTAVLEWARTNWNGPVLVWGSSFTAGLVFVLASRHPTVVAGVVAYSPLEYFDLHPWLVRDAARRTLAPVYIASTRRESAGAVAVFRAIPGQDKEMFVPLSSEVHGSSALRTDRNSLLGVRESWAGVTPFLTRNCARASNTAWRRPAD